MGKQIRVNYKQKMAYIKPFVKFGFKNPERLGKRNKSKITTYYKFIKNTERGFKPIKVKGKNNLIKAQKQLNPSFNHIKGIKGKPELKVVFVELNAPKGIKVVFKGDLALLESNNAIQSFIPFSNEKALLNDPLNYVNSLVEPYKALPGDPPRLTIQTSTAVLSIGQGKFDFDTIAGEVARLIERNYHEVSSWLLGLNLTYLTNQTPI